MHGQFSTQSDVYSFGVLILEIVSGNRTERSNQPEHVENLLSSVSMGALMFKSPNSFISIFLESVKQNVTKGR